LHGGKRKGSDLVVKLESKFKGLPDDRIPIRRPVPIGAAEYADLQISPDRHVGERLGASQIVSYVSLIKFWIIVERH